MEEPINPFSEVENEAEEIEPDFHKYQRPNGEGLGKKDVETPAEKERVSKLIAKAGIASRRAAEDLITEGRVAVNGHFVREPGVKADPSRDKIVVDGRPLVVTERETTVVLFHKPKYVMTTHDDPGNRVKVFDILPKRFAKMHSVGRLDFETTGVLLITDDGELTHLLTHPSHGFEKVYEARVRGEVTRAKIDLLQGGVVLEDGKTAPCRARVLAQTEKNALVELTLREGKNRQVRRMLEAIGHPVTSLRRTKFAGIELEGLPSGEFRVLLPGEVKALRKTVENGLKKLGAPSRPKPKPKIVNDKAEFKARRNSPEALEAKAVADRAPMKKPTTRKGPNPNYSASKSSEPRVGGGRPTGPKPTGSKPPISKPPVRRPATERPNNDKSPVARRIERKWKD
jgi:23S rRNA pseudouridine2605 synthase